MQSDTGNIPLRKRAEGAFVQTGGGVNNKKKQYVELKEQKMNRVHVTRQKDDDNVNVTRAVPLRLIVEREDDCRETYI